MPSSWTEITESLNLPTAQSSNLLFETVCALSLIHISEPTRPY